MNDINAVMRHRGEFARAIANKRYEVSDAGLLFPLQKVFVGGAFEDEHRRGGDLIGRGLGPNIIPTQGLNHLLDVIAHGTTPINPWNVGLFQTNTNPPANLTGTNFHATLTEFTAYDETTRVAFNEGAAVNGVLDNASNRAVFTINATGTVYGGALLSASAKLANGAGDLCLAAAKFAASRNVVDDDELAVKYTLTATST